MDNNKYEELLKEGYTLEEIDVILDDLSQMRVFESPIREGRDDRGVIVKDSFGKEKRTSSIMMGYNKQGINLDNGDYISWIEIEESLEKELTTDAENVTIISKKTGKKVEPQIVIQQIFHRSLEKSHLRHEPTDKVTNQQAARMIVNDEKGDHAKGISMLGNEGLQLPNGAYVSKEEVTLAIQEYVKLKGPEKTEDPEITPVPPIIPPIDIEHTNPEPIPEEKPIEHEKEEEKYTLIKRIIHKASWLPPLITAASLALSGFGRDVKIVTTTHDNLGYGVSRAQEISPKFETAEQVYNRVYKEYEIGNKVEVEKGVPFYESSDYKYGGEDSKGVFGYGLREEGKYKVDRFAIIHDGEIIARTNETDTDLVSMLEDVSSKTGIPIDKLETMIHLGGPTSGWVDVSDLITEDEKEPQVIGRKIILDETEKYTGIVEDFSGDTITIDDEGKEISINVKDDNGALVEEGTIVVGSDGQHYKITNLDLEEKENVDYEEGNLNWKLSNIELEEALALAALGLAATYISKKIPRKEMTEMTDSQIETLVTDQKKKFEEAKGEFEGTSQFQSAVETLIERRVQLPRTAEQELRAALIEQDITVEEVTNLATENIGGKSK